MGLIVAIMSAKGGVGKSTTTMMLADALTSQKEKKVLVVDADPQANSSMMLMGAGGVQVAQAGNLTLADYIQRVGMDPMMPDIEDFLVRKCSDIRGPHRPDILPGSVKLAWVERDTRDAGAATPVVRAALSLRKLREKYNYILIDCPPSVSYFTECWLEHADLHLSPAKPDVLSMAGIKLVLLLRQKASEAGRVLARDLGVLITMKRDQDGDNKWEKDEFRADQNLDCFKVVIPQATTLQHCAEYQREPRNFSDKYGRFSARVSNLADEFIERCSKIGQ